MTRPFPNFIAVLAASLVFSSPLPAADLQSAITAVTAYTGGAQVSRNGRMKLQAGEAQVTVRGLPYSLDERSVRVSARGTAAAKLRSVDVRRVFLPASGDPRVQKLETEMEGVRKEIALQDAELAGFASQRAFLESIRVGFGERISKELGTPVPRAPELGEMLRFVGENVGAVATKNDGAARRKRELEQRLDALRREVETLRAARARETKEVEIIFDVTKEGDETVELSYLVPGASWEPAYDLRLAESGKEVEMTYRGLIRQKTGEDWEKVALTLSTAKPEAGGEPPELFPWRLDYYRPPMPMPQADMMRMAPAAAPMMKMEMVMDMPEVEEAAAPETAQVREEQTAVQFDLPKKESVPADGNPHGVTVAVQGFAAAAEYFTVPKLSPQVFLKTEIVNDKPLPLLPGRANLFVGGTFVGTSVLKEIAQGEKFPLFFGADRAIKVKREDLSKRREGGFFGKDRFTGSYRIEITNFRKEPVTVTVLDQLPVPAHEEIVVKLDASEPKAEHKAETGELKWKLPLAPGEKKNVTFTFTVDSPKGRPVEGL